MSNEPLIRSVHGFFPSKETVFSLLEKAGRQERTTLYFAAPIDPSRDEDRFPVTRVTPNPPELGSGYRAELDPAFVPEGGALEHAIPALFPVGAVLWARESWGHTLPGADSPYCYRFDSTPAGPRSGWSPPVRMPRRASRVLAEVVGIDCLPAATLGLEKDSQGRQVRGVVHALDVIPYAQNIDLWMADHRPRVAGKEGLHALS